ncbi:hypothetical protein KKE03_00090 [Patescibacteria group bacterium]|nr:hypothetical protein [Patescibacteria group bacterium]
MTTSIQLEDFIKTRQEVDTLLIEIGKSIDQKQVQASNELIDASKELVSALKQIAVGVATR